MKVRRIIFLLILLIILFTTVVVYAHKPIFANNDNNTIEKAQKIENPEISWAVYSELSTKGEVDYYYIDGQKGTDLYVQMTIPQIKGHGNFKPSIAILGKEFSKEENHKQLEVPKGYGVKVIKPTTDSKDFFEPFTQTKYYIKQDETITLQNNDRYYILVYSEDNTTGKYTLAVGKKEEFGFIDIIKFPYTWLRVRLWYNMPQTFLIIILGVIFLILIAKTAKFVSKRIRKKYD